jgi:acyl-coenzyme A synthetase/AMP-(fatty) acid ligase
VGDWQGKELSSSSEEKQAYNLKPLNIDVRQIVIFTSGSTGEIKEIHKTLRQLQNEIATLEKQWGQLVGETQVLATVSHQHIYGLLFRVLWPLIAGRYFYSEMFLSPEALLCSASGKPTIWIASPAQLKRLDDLTEWQKIEKLQAIVSSGGKLPTKVANQIKLQCGIKVIEVYGSSETGGIAWRQTTDKDSWTLFAGLHLTVDNEVAYLSSPYLMEQLPFRLDDKIQLTGNGQFTLLGRMDRIVKVEEKR